MTKPSLLQSAYRQLAGAVRPFLVLILVCGGFSLNPAFLHTFWTREYLPNIAQQAATNIILAVGSTFVILTGGIDLSVGSVLALCGVALAMSVTTGPPPFLTGFIALPAGVFAGWMVLRFLSARQRTGAALWGAVVSVTVIVTAAVGWACGQGMAGGTKLEGALAAALLVGIACGLINGLTVALARVPSFVVTLGMMTAARGLTLYATNGNSVSGLPRRLEPLGKGAPLVLIALLVVVAAAILQSRTRPGRFIQAIGANEAAARLTGLDVPLYKTLTYVLSGLTAAIAAIVVTAKFVVAQTNAGTGAELNAIAAVVIGGTSLSGGRGSVLGSMVGALTIAVLAAGLVLTGVQDTLQGVIIGAVIVLAVLVDRLRGGMSD